MAPKPVTTSPAVPHRPSGRIALTATLLSVGLLAACASEATDAYEPTAARFGSADAATHALTPSVKPLTLAPRYGTADAAAHALTPTLAVVGPSPYSSADAAEHALTVVHWPGAYASADAAAHALGG